MAKKLIFGNESQEKLCSGMKKLSSAVGATIGPKGRNVLVERTNIAPAVVNRGYHVIRDFSLEDLTENMGVQLLKEIALKMNDSVGDGTTTSILLASAIAREGFRFLAVGENPVYLRKGIEKAKQEAISYLQNMSVSMNTEDRIKQVAESAGFDEEFADCLVSVMEKIGPNGLVLVKESKAMYTDFSVEDGTQFDQGLLSPYFIRDHAKEETVFENAYLLFVDKKITDFHEILPIMDRVAKVRGKLVIIADDVTGEALKALIVNCLKNTMEIAAVRAPGFGERKKELMEILALVTGGQVVDEKRGDSLADVSISQLGRATQVTMRKDRTIVIGGKGDPAKIQERSNLLKKQLSDCTDSFMEDRIKQQLEKLSQGVGVIHVGGRTQLEVQERKELFESVLRAVLAAREEGIVPGGGMCYLQTAAHLSKLEAELNGAERLGVSVIRKALKEPARNIIENAGFESKIIFYSLQKEHPGMGFDVSSCSYVNFLQKGIVDPLKTVRLALSYAASIAATVLTSEVSVVEPVEGQPLL